MTKKMAGGMRRGVRMLLLGLLLAAAGGCGGNKTGNISGTVMFQGKPLPGGFINFYSVGADGAILDQKSGPIDDKGNYSVAKVRTGDAKITVQGPAGELQANMTEKGGMPKRGKPPVILPPNYGDVKQTDLKYTVTPGEQKYEVVLK